MIKPITRQLLNTIILKWSKQTPEDKHDVIQDDADNAIFSLQAAEKFTEGNTALALELMHMLKNELPEYQIKIAAALKLKNYAELKSQVHKLHGASRCCGTPALYRTVAHMEQLIDKQLYDALATAADKLSHEIDRLLEFPIDVH